jgi:hypothetical protein
VTDRIGLFREDLFWVMDYDYWVRMFRTGIKAGFIDYELAAFRLHQKQKSTQPERTAEELLKIVYPSIFANDALIGWQKRLELKGKWLFDARFRKEADRSLQRGEGRCVRWLRLAGIVLRYPQLFAARCFRQRLRNSLHMGRAARPSVIS